MCPEKKPDQEKEKLIALLKSRITGMNKTIAGVAKDLGLNNDVTLRNYINGRNMPKMDFYDRWRTTYGEDLQQMLRGEQTNVPRVTNEEQHVSEPRETFYKDLIENNPEYSILPKAVLKDYKMIPEKIIDMIYQNNGDLKKALIDKYERIIQDLEQENEALKKKLPPNASAH